MSYIITINDIGKPVFLRVTNTETNTQRWTNDGCIFKGFTPDGTRLLILLPNGNIWAINPIYVRIFEPRPK